MSARLNFIVIERQKTHTDVTGRRWASVDNVRTRPCLKKAIAGQKENCLKERHKMPELKVGGMRSGNCQNAVSKALNSMEGLLNINVARA